MEGQEHKPDETTRHTNIEVVWRRMASRLDIPKAVADSSATDVVLRPAADTTVRPAAGGSAGDDRVLIVETAATPAQDTSVALLRCAQLLASSLIL